MTTLTMSTAPSSARAASESANDDDSAKTIVAPPNAATAANIVRADAPPQRVPREIQRRRERADSGRAAQHAEPGRPDVQDVLGVDRQERRRAAQQHGEQIERDGAEDHGVSANVVEPGEQRFQTGRFALARRGAAARCAR